MLFKITPANSTAHQNEIADYEKKSHDQVDESDIGNMIDALEDSLS